MGKDVGAACVATIHHRDQYIHSIHTSPVKELKGTGYRPIAAHVPTTYKRITSTQEGAADVVFVELSDKRETKRQQA